MDFDDHYKFSMDNEINTTRRRIDSIRSSLLQLQALKGQLDWVTLAQRRADLLQEYSYEVDKEDETNSFITSAMVFAKESSRPIRKDNWFSIYYKRLQEGMSALDIITSLNPKLAPMTKLSSQFKNIYKNRIIYAKPTNTSEENFSTNLKPAKVSQDSNDDVPRIAKYIEKQIAGKLTLTIL